MIKIAENLQRLTYKQASSFNPLALGNLNPTGSQLANYGIWGGGGGLLGSGIGALVNALRGGSKLKGALIGGGIGLGAGVGAKGLGDLMGGEYGDLLRRSKDLPMSLKDVGKRLDSQAPAQDAPAGSTMLRALLGPEASNSLPSSVPGAVRARNMAADLAAIADTPAYSSSMRNADEGDIGPEALAALRTQLEANRALGEKFLAQDADKAKKEKARAEKDWAELDAAKSERRKREAGNRYGNLPAPPPQDENKEKHEGPTKGTRSETAKK